MTDLSLTTKKNKLTYTASIKGVEKAEKALRRLGFESKANFAESQLLSRSTVTKFFGRQPIQLDSFKRICNALKLKWEEITEILEVSAPFKEVSISSEQEKCSISGRLEEVGQVMTTKRQVTVIDKHAQTKACIKLEGDINSVDNNFKLILETILRESSGDTIIVTDIKSGSIKVFIEGSQEDIQKLVSRIKSKDITEVNSFRIIDIQVLSEHLNDAVHNDKWRLVEEIKVQGAEGRNLKGADLSDADLSSASLRNADLIDADFSDADLSYADLIGADLRNANLQNANLIGANLIGTILIRANLTGANLIRANPNYANLSYANLIRTNLIGTNLRRANLTCANLRDANLIRTSINDADLSNADLSGSNLSGASLSNSNLTRASFSNSNLSGADLRDAKLQNANFSGTNLIGADLRDANLQNADLSDTDFNGANFSGANLSGANLQNANLQNANVTKTQFRNNEEISQSIKQDLIKRGAIFEDSPGDRSQVLV
ncbi:hypothetical protein CAL7716_057370 [Calothrix sp. PCC 7716]|nr:hypothetical protein CAL7716_057370 [Calothrix sp. PCC 7716]